MVLKSLEVNNGHLSTTRGYTCGVSVVFYYWFHFFSPPLRFKFYGIYSK